jgi:hypothetical protein
LYRETLQPIPPLSEIHTVKVIIKEIYGQEKVMGKTKEKWTCEQNYKFLSMLIPKETPLALSGDNE